MSSNFTILQKITNQTLLAQYYSLADVFVICSKRENFPTTCIEAQCCGTPVVGFDTGGTKETSLSSENDFVPYGDIEGLAKKIKHVIIRGKENIASKAMTSYSREAMSNNYMREYSQYGDFRRVLLIDNTCKFTSTGKIVYDLYTKIRKSGKDAAICYGRGELIREEKIFKFGLDWETYLHAGLARITGYNGIFSMLSTDRLIRFIEEYKPDVVHIHELHAYFVNIYKLLTYLKSNHIPVIWTFHCEYMYTGKCGHANDCLGFQNVCGNCPELRSYPKSIAFDRTKELLAMKKKILGDWDFEIVTPSQWLMNRVKMSFLNTKSVKVIHNGVDTDVFHPYQTDQLREKLRINPKTKIVLAAAPNIFTKEKGGDQVLKIAKELENENIHFILIGANKKDIANYSVN